MIADTIKRAAELFAKCDSLLITAGSGMGVDSGLPSFRGKSGFWKLYPALAESQRGFSDVATPEMFRRNPRLAWGFYGHRLLLYRQTVPHEGFTILRTLGAKFPRGTFVFTSNVDGQFQRAGFDPAHIEECHGSINYLQCLDHCSGEIWSADPFGPEVDEARCELIGPLPTCPCCGRVARPNILMFNDDGWNRSHVLDQTARRWDWLDSVKRPLVIELGAGREIGTVRDFGEQHGFRIIRINPEHWRVTSGKGVGLQGGALERLEALAAEVGALFQG